MNDINLIPRPLRMARSRRRRIKGWSVCVVAALIILCIPILFDQFRRVEAARLATQKEELVQIVSGLRHQLAALRMQSDRSDLQLQRAKSLRSKRAWSAMITTIARSMPDGCWLTSIATDPARPSGSGVQRMLPVAPGKATPNKSITAIEAPRRLKIVGFASDSREPYAFVTNIKAANVFSRVTLTSTTRNNAGGASFFRFDLECEW